MCVWILGRGELQSLRTQIAGVYYAITQSLSNWSLPAFDWINFVVYLFGSQRRKFVCLAVFRPLQFLIATVAHATDIPIVGSDPGMKWTPFCWCNRDSVSLYTTVTRHLEQFHRIESRKTVQSVSTLLINLWSVVQLEFQAMRLASLALLGSRTPEFEWPLNMVSRENPLLVFIRKKDSCSRTLFRFSVYPTMHSSSLFQLSPRLRKTAHLQQMDECKN